MDSLDISVILPIHSLAYFKSTWHALTSINLVNIELEVLLVLDRVERSAIQHIIEDSNLRIRVIDSAGPGIVSTLNTGLYQANGKFIARIDEDDIIFSNRLQLQKRYLEKNSTCMAIGSSLALIDEQNNWIGSSYYPRSIKKVNTKLFKRNPLAHPAVMFRREAAIELGGYREGFAEDWDLWIRLLSKGYLRNSFRPLTAYRVHPHQLSRNNMYRPEIAGLKLALDYYSSIKPSNQSKQESNSLSVTYEQRKFLELQKVDEYFQHTQFPKKELIRTISGIRYLIGAALNKLCIACKNRILTLRYFSFVRKNITEITI